MSPFFIYRQSLGEAKSSYSVPWKQTSHPHLVSILLREFSLCTFSCYVIFEINSFMKITCQVYFPFSSLITLFLNSIIPIIISFSMRLAIKEKSILLAYAGFSRELFLQQSPGRHKESVSCLKIREARR